MFRIPTKGEVLGILAYLTVLALLIVGAVLLYPSVVR